MVLEKNLENHQIALAVQAIFITAKDIPFYTESVLFTSMDK